MKAPKPAGVAMAKIRTYTMGTGIVIFIKRMKFE